MRKSASLFKSIYFFNSKIVLPICLLLLTALISCTKDELVGNEPEALIAPKKNLNQKSDCNRNHDYRQWK